MEVLRTREELAIDAILGAARASQRGYQQAAELSEDPALRQLFTELAELRAELIEGTAEACREHQVPLPGEDPDRQAMRAVGRRVAHSVGGDSAELEAQRSLEEQCVQIATEEAERDDNPVWVRSLATRHQNAAEHALEQLAAAER